MLESGERDSPFAVACAFGAIDLVTAMVTTAGVNVAQAIGKSGKHCLLSAVSFDIEEFQPYVDFTFEGIETCDKHFVRSVAQAADGKIAVVKYLAPMCGKATIAEALSAAQAQREDFQSNLDYHREDCHDNLDDEEEPEDCIYKEGSLNTEGFCACDDDPDSMYASDMVQYADMLIAALQNE